MLARIATAALVGIDAIPITVEVDVSGGGLPGLTLVGLPDATVRESRDRVRTAIRNAGFPFPGSRVTVSLAPADIRKVGAGFDLPIALGVLAASGALPFREKPPFLVAGPCGVGLTPGETPYDCTSYSRSMVIPGIGTGYRPSALGITGAGPSYVKSATPGAISCGQLSICS